MSSQWAAWGTTVRVELTDERYRAAAEHLIRRVITHAERAANTEFGGNQLSHTLRSAGRPVRVGPALSGLLQTALDMARYSAGAVDPTVGGVTLPLRRAALRGSLPVGGPFPVCTALPSPRPRPAPGWRSVGWTDRSITLAAGVALDLTALGKAVCAREAADAVAHRCGVGVLVEIGGDVATAGPAPRGGWVIIPEHADGAVVRLAAGTAVASVRGRGLVDPLTGRRVDDRWLAAIATGTDLVEAKTAAITALVGPDAAGYLRDRGRPALLIGAAGAAHLVALAS